MRNFTILFGWLVGTITMQGQPYDTQAFRSGLRGNPKQVTTTEHLFFTSTPSNDNGQESYTVISTYNRQGICTGQKMFSTGGTLIGTSEYKFDRNGNVYEIDYTGEYDDLATRLSYTYNSFGKWQSCRTYQGGFRQTELITYRYNTDNRVDQIQEFSSSNLLRKTEEIIYNAAGQDSITLFRDRRGKITSRNLYSYVCDSLLSAYTSFDGNGILTEHYTASYNDNDIISHAQTKWFNPRFYKEISCQYDSLGNVIRQEETVNVPSYVVTETTVTYQYDPVGNWIRKTIVKDGQLISQSEREIVYYTPEKLP